MQGMIALLFTILHILKVLLIVILCLFLFVLLLILFCPLRYEGAMKGHGKEFTASAKVSWLFSLIGARLTLEDFKPSLSFLLLGMPLDQLKKRKGRDKKAASSGKEKTGKKTAANISENKKAAKNDTSEKVKEVTQSAKDTSSEISLKEADIKDKGVSEDSIAKEAKIELQVPEKGVDQKADDKESRSRKDTGSSLAERLIRLLTSAAAKIGNLAKKIVSLPAQGAKSLESGKKKLKRTEKKLVRMQKLLAREEIKNALFLALNKFSRLLKHIVPRKFSGEVSYGFADPGDTGMLLAFLSTLYPVHRGNLKIYPDFQDKLFIYDVTFKGRIYGLVLISIALRLLFDKNIQFIIRIIRKKEA